MSLFDRFRFDVHDPLWLLTAVFYLLKNGCQSPMLPKEFPPWQTVYYHFRTWRRPNLVQPLCDRVRRAARVADGRSPNPRAAVIDTQSVDSARQGGPKRGPDPSMQVKGRKRHVIVDAMGFFLAVLVHSANEHDSQMAPFLLQRILGKVPRLKSIFADSGYKGLPGGLVWRCFHWILQIVRGEEKTTGFEPLAKRWLLNARSGRLGPIGASAVITSTNRKRRRPCSERRRLA